MVLTLGAGFPPPPPPLLGIAQSVHASKVLRVRHEYVQSCLYTCNIDVRVKYKRNLRNIDAITVAVPSLQRTTFLTYSMQDGQAQYESTLAAGAGVPSTCE